MSNAFTSYVVDVVNDINKGMGMKARLIKTPLSGYPQL
jgi:hypothetical protein